MAVSARMIVLDGDLPVGEIQEPAKEDVVLPKLAAKFALYSLPIGGSNGLYGSSLAWPAYSTSILYDEVGLITYATLGDTATANLGSTLTVQNYVEADPGYYTKC